MIQCYIFVCGKSMWTSRIINTFEGEIRARCLNQWDDSQVWVWEALPYLKRRNLGLHDQSLSFPTKVCGSVSWLKQRTFLRTSEEELLMLTKLERVPKPFLKSLDSTSQLSGRPCTNWRRPTPSLPSPGVVEQQKSQQERACNTPGGHRGPRGNVSETKGLSCSG